MAPKVNLHIGRQVKLLLHGDKADGDVNWLKLRSDPSGFVWLKAIDGEISIDSSKVTSWDEQSGTFDTAFEDGSGRAFILAKRTANDRSSNMDVIDSEIAYLGHQESSSFGITWKNRGDPGAGMTGNVIGSKFHHNYFGTYTFAANDMVWRGNEIYENFRYGLDPHDYSTRFLVEGNVSHDNGWHGIIFARECSFNTIRGNVSFNNGGHGIMLHESSNNNLIEDNEVYGNIDGIALFQSSDNLLEDNEIYGNSRDGIYIYDDSHLNAVKNSDIRDNGRNGIYINCTSQNLIEWNAIRDNYVGIREDSPNTVIPSTGNTIQHNTLKDNRSQLVHDPVLSPGNLVENNLVESTKRAEEWDLMLFARAGLLGTFALLPVLVAAVAYLRKRAVTRQPQMARDS